jgi:hypothetical protein
MEEELSGNKDVPGSVRLIRITAKQANKGVSIIKQPGGQY